MWYYYVIGIVAIVLSAYIGHYLTKKNIKIEQKNADEEYARLAQANEEHIQSLQNSIQELSTSKININEEIIGLNAEKDQLNEAINKMNCSLADLTISRHNEELEVNQLTTAKKELLAHMAELNEQAQTAANNYYIQTMALANKRIEDDIEKAEQNYTTSTNQYKLEYLKCLEDYNTDFQQHVTEKEQELSNIAVHINDANATLTDLTQKIATIIESRRIEEMTLNEKEYYKCNISDLDQQEIVRLREVEFYLRDKRPLCKIIWESYYRDAASALITRLLGKDKACGIYKITNLINNKVYIGQSVNLADRLTTHMKAGVGIDANNNKMYQDMKKQGLETFTFEILEQCPQKQLNEKEKYWIEFYHSQEFGYNNTKGGS